MEEESWRRESWRMNHGRCIMEESSGRRQPGGGSREEAPGGTQELQEPRRRQQEHPGEVRVIPARPECMYCWGVRVIHVLLCMCSAVEQQTYIDIERRRKMGR